MRLFENKLLTKLFVSDADSKRDPEKTGTLQKILLG